jgi:hypothetical protein
MYSTKSLPLNSSSAKNSFRVMISKVLTVSFNWQCLPVIMNLVFALHYTMHTPEGCIAPLLNPRSEPNISIMILNNARQDLNTLLDFHISFDFIRIQTNVWYSIRTDINISNTSGYTNTVVIVPPITSCGE